MICTMSLNLFIQYSQYTIIEPELFPVTCGKIFNFIFYGVKNTVSSKYNTVSAGPKQQIAVFIQLFVNNYDKFFSKNINKNWSGKPNASVSKTLFLTYDLCLKCVIIHLTVKLFPVSYITTAVVVSIVSEISNNKKKNEYNITVFKNKKNVNLKD